MDKITLINLPSPFLANPMVMPPLGLMYISSSLKKKGVEVCFEDMATGIGTTKNSDFYGISSTTPQFLDAVKVLENIKRKNPNAKVCIGGPVASLCPEECLRAGFDTVIMGEGVSAIFQFLSGLEGIIDNPPLEDVDSIPFPDRSLSENYVYDINGKKATTIISSYGCPYSCAFCCKTWRNTRYRSWESVAKELRDISKLGYDGVMFYDDEMLVRKERDKNIFETLSSLGFVWRCFTRSDLIDKGMANFMSNKGCKEILLGVESGNDNILNNVNKGITVSQNRRSIKIISDSGIRVKVAMMVGLPGESGETLKDTWNFCEEVEDMVSDWDFSVLMPYPGSPIYDTPEDFDVQFDKSEIWSPYKGGKWESVVSTSHLSKDEITGWRKEFHERFKGEVY